MNVKGIYRILLTFNSIMVYFVVYLINNQVVIPSVGVGRSYVLYFAIVLCFSLGCLKLSDLLPAETIMGGIKEIELADGSYLPSYLGYFFVALSVKNLQALMWVGVVIGVFTYFSQTLYFNPVFLIFGYRFYYLTMDNGMTLFVLTKRDIKAVEGLRFNNLNRINDYTFIDRSGTK